MQSLPSWVTLSCKIVPDRESERVSERELLRSHRHAMRALADNLRHVNVAFLKLVFYQNTIKVHLLRMISRDEKFGTRSNWKKQLKKKFDSNVEKFSRSKRLYGRKLLRMLKVGIKV